MCFSTTKCIGIVKLSGWFSSQKGSSSSPSFQGPVPAKDLGEALDGGVGSRAFGIFKEERGLLTNILGGNTKND